MGKACYKILLLLLLPVSLAMATPTALAEQLPYLAADDFPAIGKWMLTAEGTPANWLNQKYRGKELSEPINIVIIDGTATSPEEAKTRLIDSIVRAGYAIRFGHSGEYRGLIGNRQYGQLPEQANHAFSDRFFIFPNNHGRVFGPHYHDGKYYFTAAFSRESIDIFAEVKHVYASFAIARDDFAKRLAEYANYRLAGRIHLENSLPPESGRTTGDHDGAAVVLIRD